MVCLNYRITLLKTIYLSIYALVVRSTSLQTRCIKKFLRRYVSKNHLQSHREEQALACDVCKKNFKSSSALKLHVCSYTGEKSFTCDVCNKTFMMSGNLNAHLHTHAGQQPFTCGLCKKCVYM